MRRLRSVRLFLCLVLLFPTIASADAPYSSEEIAEAARWFRQLPWPVLKGKAYVEIEHEENQVMRGFLLSEDSKSWEILPDRPTLCMLTLVESPSYLPVRISKQFHSEQLQLRSKSLHEVTQEALALVKDQGRVVSTPELFALARLVEIAGAADCALRLDQAFPVEPSGEKDSLKTQLEKEVASGWFADGYQAMKNVSVPRSKVVVKFENIAKHFPGCDGGKMAASYARTLREMITEDDAHEKTNTRPISARTAEEKAREYIYQLRDQTGHQWSNKSPCDIFCGQGDDPSQKLAALGLSAAPALIEALSDERLTRTIGMPRMRSSQLVWTNADCAEAILSRIAGRNFECSDSDPAQPNREKELAGVRERATKWLREAQSRGEHALWVEGIRSDAHDSTRLAELLMARDPEKAMELIEERLGVMEDAWTAETLLRVVAENQTPPATALLKRVLKQGRWFGLRVLAGEELFRRKDPVAVPALIEEWKAWMPQEKGDNFLDGDDNDPDGLIQLLAAANSPEAAQALAARFEDVSCEIRCEILRSVSSNFEFDLSASLQVLGLHETLMIKALADRAVRSCSGSEGDIEYMNPRVCDLAAIGLFTRWPKKYPLQWRVTRVERDGEIAKLRNIWRKENQLPELPIAVREEHPNAGVELNTIAGIRWKESVELPIRVGETLTPQALVETLLRLRNNPVGWTDISIDIERPEDRKGIVIVIETAKTDIRGGDWDQEVTVISGSKGNFPEQEDDEHPEEHLEQLLGMEGSRPFCLYVRHILQASDESE